MGSNLSASSSFSLTYLEQTRVKDDFLQRIQVLFKKPKKKTFTSEESRERRYSVLALYPGGIPRSEPRSCEAPRQPTIYNMSVIIEKA